MAKTSPYSFIVLLPNSIIEIPQSSNFYENRAYQTAENHRNLF